MRQQSGESMKLTCLKILGAGIAIILSTSAEGHEGHHDAAAKGVTIKAPAVLGSSVFNLNSTWTNEARKSTQLSEFRGKPSVMVMAYTSCEHACPLLMEDMKKIEAVLGKKKADSMNWLFFSLDSDRDTSDALLAYAEKRKLNMSHWILLRADPKAVRELAAVLGVQFKRDATGDFDHSNVISLLNSEGELIYQQVGLNQDPAGLISKAKALPDGT
jgi:protein SCO1/2